MNDKNLAYETTLMALPPLHLVMGEFSTPGSERQVQVTHPKQKVDRDLEDTIKRLIAHLKETGK
jgi:hypothetical protein